jgi:chlorobactene glucosyltransferase
MEFLHVGILIILLFFLLNLIQNIKRLQLNQIKLEEPLPLISVLIPARNEEKNIKNCLLSLLESDYPRLEIIVVDDNSRDDTYDIVKKLSKAPNKLRILKGKVLPHGWNGKNWACHQLAEAARGDWFLFTDADTSHKPHSVSVAFSEARARKSVFLTCIPGLITKTWAEKLYLPIIHFAFVALAPYKLINYHKDSRLSFGIGPFLFIKRDFYFSFGGHKAIKSDVLDDIALAKKVKENQGKISIIDGTKILDVRFYSCCKEVWNGFSKNHYEFIGNAPHYLVLVLVVCYFLFIYPYLSLWEAVAYRQDFALPLFQVMTLSLIKLILSLRFKTSLLFGQLHPFTVILAFLILLNSFRLSLFKKKIEWKERYYPID